MSIVHNSCDETTAISEHSNIRGQSADQDATDTDSDGQIDDLVATTSHSYNDAGQLTDLVHAQDTTKIAAYNWTFDAAGRTREFLHTDYTDTDHTSTYTYDDAGQLTAADHDTQDDEAYAYDDNGNRIPGNGETYATGDHNRMTTDGTYVYQYDDEGNRTLRYVDADESGSLNTGDTDITAYDYDHRNRLVEVADYATYADYVTTPTPITTMTAEYIYDVNGDRIAKIVDADGSGSGAAVRTNFVVLDSEILLELNGQTLAYHYLPGLGIDMNLAIEETATNDVLWSLPDHQGTVRDVIDSSGIVQNHIEYDTFGNITSESDDTVEYRFTYTGRELDGETGLYYYRARYYDAATGQFISTDPIAFEGGDANLYRYVSNSPMMGTDPYGEWNNRYCIQSKPGRKHGKPGYYRTYRTAWGKWYQEHSEERTSLWVTFEEIPQMPKISRVKAGYKGKMNWERRRHYDTVALSLFGHARNEESKCPNWCGIVAPRLDDRWRVRAKEVEKFYETAYLIWDLIAAADKAGMRAKHVQMKLKSVNKALGRIPGAFSTIDEFNPPVHTTESAAWAYAEANLPPNASASQVSNEVLGSMFLYRDREGKRVFVHGKEVAHSLAREYVNQVTFSAIAKGASLAAKGIYVMGLADDAFHLGKAAGYTDDILGAIDDPAYNSMVQAMNGKGGATQYVDDITGMGDIGSHGIVNTDTVLVLQRHIGSRAGAALVDNSFHWHSMEGELTWMSKRSGTWARNWRSF